MSLLVVDASVAAKWFLNEADSGLAVDLFKSRVDLSAPTLLPTEIANILWRRVLHSGVHESVWARARPQLNARVSIVQSGPDLSDSAFALALAHRHPVYDCLYLALALTLDCRVVTADRRFASVFASGATAGRVVLLDDWAAART